MVTIYKYKRKRGTYVLVQVRVTQDERQRIRELCYALDISIPQFFRRLLAGKIPDYVERKNQGAPPERA